VNVPARGHAVVKMTLSVRAGDGNFNQHWSLAVAVRSKPAEGQMLSLALYPRFEIETASSVVTPAGWKFWTRTKRPAGDLTITPAVCVVKARPGGPPEQVRLTVWNNTGKPWRGTITLVTGEEAVKKERLALTSAWQWLPDASWATLNETSLLVKPHNYGVARLSVAVPDKKENYGRMWEAIVLARSEDGLTAISRLRVTSPEKPQDRAGEGKAVRK
jgi:hypothetical protein